jgi:hypothetical protein
MTIRITHKFVEYIPAYEELKEDTLYISISYCTAVHKCFCGCGNEVVTPISPNDWKLTFDGKTISLYPSIGNFAFPCQSHYWIEKDTVIPAQIVTKKTKKNFFLRLLEDYKSKLR